MTQARTWEESVALSRRVKRYVYLPAILMLPLGLSALLLTLLGGIGVGVEASFPWQGGGSILFWASLFLLLAFAGSQILNIFMVLEIRKLGFSFEKDAHHYYRDVMRP